MYDHNARASFDWSSLDHQVRLDKHQEMIRNAIYRQQMSKLLRDEPKAKTFPRRSLVLTTLLNLLTHYIRCTHIGRTVSGVAACEALAE